MERRVRKEEGTGVLLIEKKRRLIVCFGGKSSSFNTANSSTENMQKPNNAPLGGEGLQKCHGSASVRGTQAQETPCWDI